MIKRAFYLLLLWLAAVSGPHTAAAGADLRFAVLPLAGDEVTEKTAMTVGQRIEQGLSRSYALSDNPYEVFAVNPTLLLGDVMETAGMVRDVAVVNAELTLAVINKIDGTVYHTATFPLKATATDGREKAVEKMAASLKATDPAFVRFVRQARQKIEDYYAANCFKILATAQTLADTGRSSEAIAYLSAVSPSVECYDLASTMMTELSDVPQPQPIVEVVEVVEVPVMPEAEPAPEPAPERQPAVPNPEIILGSDDMRFSIVSCKGDWSTHRINIEAKFENLQRNSGSAYAYVESAFDSEGSSLADWGVKSYHGNWTHGTSLDTPYQVPIKMYYFISGFDGKVTRLSYVEFVIRNVKVIVKNLPVEW